MKFDKHTHMLLETGAIASRALIVGALGLALTLLGVFMDRAQFFQAYLTSFTFLTTISLGGLFFVLIHHVTGAYWGIVLRRVAENLADTLPLMALFMIPLFFGMHDLFHWTHEEAVAHDQILQWKQPYLNVGFFVVRNVLYFAVWIWLVRGLKTLSLKQDKGDSGNLVKMRRRAAGGVVLFAFTVTGFGFDWLMSLDPHWYSTIFGVYVFSGGFWAALALLSLFTNMLRKSGADELITMEHTHDLGKFMFAFTAWWAYIGGAQYFLIWYGNIPEETIWFIHRWEHGWKAVSLFLILFHFIIPFVILAFRAAKRVPALIVSLAVLFLVMHYTDHFWMINPVFNDHHLHVSWMHLTALLGMGGVYLWWFFFNSSKHPIVVMNDPKLEKSIKHIVH
ncbi:MAG: hypothetical protein K9M49_05915 [Candidatus Marinimicrobia bacterium]|nr:hypothetical protein [Candidatus Neomarinimicrobiota bacterium]MCF7904670.1 hypothetical protein [Candidatus Neomarinimicrobiota bacterium]